MQEKKFPIRPLRSDIIIREADPQKFSDGSHGVAIHLPERAQDSRAHRYGEVVAVGNGPDVPASVGDLVAYPTTWRGRSFEWDGTEYRVLDPDDAMAIVQPGAYLENEEL